MEGFLKVCEENRAWADETYEKILKKLRRTAVRSYDKLPYTTVNGVHDDKALTDVNWWTNGFFAGMLWLLYEASGEEGFRKTAEHQEVLLDAALKNYKGLYHDVGFMWHLSSGANYRLTGNEDSMNRNLFAASVLASRYHLAGDFIRAWNGEEQAGYSIIDCLMNLSLLYWASDEIGDDRFRQIAIQQMNMSLRDHIRSNGSVNHIVDHERTHPGVKQVLAGQGYSQTSCWSRGLAWAVYGSMISYIHVGDPLYLQAARRTADYFIDHVKKTGYLPVIDFEAPETPVYYDSTAGVCAACGILELSKVLPEEEGKYYAEEAVRILQAIETEFADYSEGEDALLMMGSERYPNEESGNRGLHIPIIYGDFFLIEAICKLRGREFFIW